MVTVRLGNTGIVANKNGFGALPIQRIDIEHAVKLIHMALDGGDDFLIRLGHTVIVRRNWALLWKVLIEVNIILLQRRRHRQARRF